MERTYCLSCAHFIFTNLRPGRSEFIDRYLVIFKNLRQERNELIPRFLPIFTNLIPTRNESIARFLAIFTNLKREKNGLIARFWPFSWILEQKGTKLYLDFWLFSRNLDQEGINLLLDFWPCVRILDPKGMNFLLDYLLFSRISDQKGMTVLLGFGYLHEFETRNEWNYCSIFAGSHEFETRNVARKPAAVNLYAVTEIIRIWFFKRRTGVKHKVYAFWRDQMEGSWGLFDKMTLHQTMNITDLLLRQHTSKANSPRNLLTKTEAKVVSGWFSEKSVIEYLSSSSSIYLKRISFYSYLAEEFTKREYLRRYFWSVFILFLCF